MQYKDIHYTLSDVNCCIFNSYLITDESEMRDFCEHALPAHFLQRPIESYIREWKAHNWLYRHNIAAERTRDTDLNINEYWYRRLGYWFINLFC